MSERISIVVTSIFSPNQALRLLADGAMKNGWDFLVIGDAKSPHDFSLPGSTFFDLEAQRQLDFKLATLCPVGHYSRKNLGYLLAIQRGSTSIVETDDDNLPREEFWEERKARIVVDEVKGEGWLNVYSFFTTAHIWPRGLPLENILTQTRVFVETEQDFYCPIQQGLADGNPDVDAVFRLTQSHAVMFDKRSPVILSAGLWSPFNSQNTTWFKDAFALLYLPSYCSFRMTDIWRSFVAQRIAWECGWQVMYHNATVFQERNEHNLLRDFEQEIPGYLLNNKIRNILEGLPLQPGVEHIGANLKVCYQALVDQHMITDAKELDLVDAWLADLKVLKVTV